MKKGWLLLFCFMSHNVSFAADKKITFPPPPTDPAKAQKAKELHEKKTLELMSELKNAVAVRRAEPPNSIEFLDETFTKLSGEELKNTLLHSDLQTFPPHGKVFYKDGKLTMYGGIVPSYGFYNIGTNIVCSKTYSMNGADCFYLYHSSTGKHAILGDRKDAKLGLVKIEKLIHHPN